MTAASERAAQRLRAALDEQRAALGEPAWAGSGDPDALGRACTFAVLQALAAGQAPCPGALREAARYLAGLTGGEDMTAAVDSLTRQAAQVESAAGSSAAGGGSTGYAEAGSGELWLVEVKQVLIMY